MIKRLCILLSMVMCVMIMGCDAQNNVTEENRPGEATDKTEVVESVEETLAEESDALNNERPYPCDVYGSLDTAYGCELLARLCRKEELSETDEGLVNFMLRENEKGMAVLDNHYIGMQKMVLQVYKTVDDGKTWQVVDGMVYMTGGKVDYSYVNGRILFSNYASVLEENVFFFMDSDGGIEYVTDEQLSALGFENKRLHALLEDKPGEEGIVCTWYADYKFDEVVYTSVHDEKMNVISVF